ncbi:hypothetical protein OROHE_002168 [Orobanche hederae]
MRPRPSPLRIHKESHAIHKPSSPYASSNPHHQHNHQPFLENSGGGGGGGTKHCGGGPAAKRPPVIIYTQSPKIIHTQPQDFMTLVQKLTGLEWAEEGKEEKNIARSDQSESTTDEDSVSNNYNHHTNNNYIYNVGHDENEPSSGVITDVGPDSSPLSSSMYEVCTNNLNNRYLIDAVPYFSPSSSDFSCSSSSRPSPMMFGSGSIANHCPVSPSFVDLVKGFPDY